jgi:hypothetical protein
VLKSYLFVMRMLRAPGKPLGEAAVSLFEALGPLFAPRRFVFSIDQGELSYLTRSERMRWNGEELTGEALTRCEPGEANELLAELRERLAATRPKLLWVGADGALRHRAPRTADPAWYGRWRLQRSLHEIIEPSFTWEGSDPAVEIRFPHAGYPLTSVELRGQPDGERVLDDGDAAAAAANRAAIAEVLARLPEAIGLTRADVEWQLHGDTEALAARYPEDARAVEALVARL